MKKTKLTAFVLIAALSLPLCACGEKSGGDAPAEAPAADLTKGFVIDLTEGFKHLESTFEIADGWSNGSMFNCTWRAGNCVFDGEGMTLTIENDVEGSAPPYSGSEFRSRDFFGYGYYEVEMKPIKNDGVVSSFFTYTGPSDNNPWDEIDIEFLGKDTTSVQFNYFKNGKGGHEKVYSLGFDASEEYHSYGFDWKEGSIAWYVDGELVHAVMDSVPVTPSKIMMNVWPGIGVDGWLKAFDDSGMPLNAHYRSISYDPNGKQKS